MHKGDPSRWSEAEPDATATGPGSTTSRTGNDEIMGISCFATQVFITPAIRSETRDFGPETACFQFLAGVMHGAGPGRGRQDADLALLEMRPVANSGDPRLAGRISAKPIGLP